MRQLVFSALIAFFALGAAPLFAQESAATLPTELGWLKFRISAGRLQVASPQYRESRSYESGNPLAGTSETLRLNISSQAASVHYTRTTPNEVLTVDFDSPKSTVIELLPGDDTSGEIAAVKYVQPKDGPVQLTIDDGQQTRKQTAASFWHLLMLAPEDAKKALLPILSMLRPGWPIEQTADGIEKSLVKLAGSPHRPDRDHWKELVHQLGSSSFQQRRRAERQLREAGPAVVAYLSALPTDSLDAERQARIARLLSSLSSSADDTPDRIAMWLVDDPLVWSTVLQSDDANHRAIAKDQLEHLLGQSIDFDLEGDEEQRAVQLRAVRSLIENR